MLLGCDIYHGNAPFDHTFGQFQIHKLTEGRTFLDPDVRDWATLREDDKYLNAVYHFAGDGKNVLVEADHFISELEKLPIAGRVIPILDLEGKCEKLTNKTLAIYAYDFIRIVEKDYGVKPVLYLNTNLTSRLAGYRSTILKGIEIWIASYNKQLPAINWSDKTWLIWQFTTKPFDIDMFFGTEETWRERARRI